MKSACGNGRAISRQERTADAFGAPAELSSRTEIGRCRASSPRYRHTLDCEGTQSLQESWNCKMLTGWRQCFAGIGGI